MGDYADWAVDDEIFGSPYENETYFFSEHKKEKPNYVSRIKRLCKKLKLGFLDVLEKYCLFKKRDFNAQNLIKDLKTNNSLCESIKSFVKNKLK